MGLVHALRPARSVTTARTNGQSGAEIVCLLIPLPFGGARRTAFFPAGPASVMVAQAEQRISTASDVARKSFISGPADA